VSDPYGERLGGTTIIARTETIRRTIEADRSGCYELKDLPAATYRVTARLQGFDNVTNDGVKIEPGTASRLDFVTRVSGICECVWAGKTLQDRWNLSDAVLHVRAVGPDPAEPHPKGYYRHVALVLEILKAAGGAPGPRLWLLQNQESGALEPYDRGQELVVFARAWRENAYLIINDNPGLASGRAGTAAMAFPIENGRIQSTPPDFPQYKDTPLDAFLRELRSFARTR